ncbi:unnamed protein product, partial [Rotaria magnacalcarata]
MRVRIQTSTLLIVYGRQLDQDMDTKLFDNDQQVEFQYRMILNEN